MTPSFGFKSTRPLMTLYITDLETVQRSVRQGRFSLETRSEVQRSVRQGRFSLETRSEVLVVGLKSRKMRLAECYTFSRLSCEPGVADVGVSQTVAAYAVMGMTRPFYM